MLQSMAIRMKEWGLLAYPRQAVHLPLSALNDWGRSGRALGQGGQELGQGLASLAPALSKVTGTGQKADATAMLREIANETTEELLELPVRDWDYSWQQAYEPRVREMLNSFSGEEREQARRMSAELGRLYSLDGRRKMELKRIGSARQHWQDEVEHAVQRGDADAACRWVEQGRDVFVPESDMGRQLESVRNRSLQASWQAQLQQNPYAALTAWQDAESSKPEEGDLRDALENDMQKARAGLFSNLAMQLAASVEQETPADADLLNRAVLAGVLSREQVDSAQQPLSELSVADTCNWLRRIDERENGDDEQLMVDIALAPVPPAQRRLLLQRLQATAALPPQQRSAVSRTLWNLYRRGSFGCPGDAEAMLRLGRLQEEAVMRMSTEPESAMTGWLESLRRNADSWVCFDEQ